MADAHPADLTLNPRHLASTVRDMQIRVIWTLTPRSAGRTDAHSCLLSGHFVLPDRR